MRGKKKAQIAISTIIIIVLGLVVLVVLIMGFSSGWSNLWDRVTGFGGGKVNVQSVIQACELSCATSETYNYCLMVRKANFQDGKTAEGSCEALNSVSGFSVECSTISCSQVDAVRCKKGGDVVDCVSWVEIKTKDSTSTGGSGVSGSGAVAINLPDESRIISYAKVTEKNSLLEKGGTALA